jgi:transposase
MRVATVVSGSSPIQTICPPRTVRTWNGRPSKLVAWGATIGPSVAELMETILRTRPHPEHGYRACLGLMHLGKRYEPERMLAACQRALQIGSTSYRSVNAILKNGLDKVPLPLEAESLAKIVPIQHTNLRGAAYYQQSLMEA